MLITNLSEQLRRDEGEVLHAYQDRLGYWTIGVGRLIDPRKGGRISHEESELLLANDVARVEQEINAALPWSINLDPVRRAVLLNMAFNLGVIGLLGFHMTLDKIKAGDYEGAAKQMLQSLWAKQVGVRATRLSEQMKTAQFQ